MERVLVEVITWLVIFGAVFLVGTKVSKRHKQRIRDHLSARSATNLVISREWSTGGYYVEYTDRQHRRRGAHCTIVYRWFGGSELYWKDSV